MTAPEESCMFDQWGGGIREMCERGFMNYVVGEKKAFCLSPAFTPIPEQEAKLEMARRYFTYMGPSTIRDAMYYFHETAAQVRDWLSKLPVSEAECEGKPIISSTDIKHTTGKFPNASSLRDLISFFWLTKRRKVCF